MSPMRPVCFVRLMVGLSPVQGAAGVRFSYEAPSMERGQDGNAADC